MLKYIDVINVRVYLYGDTWKLEVEDGLYGDKKHNSIPAENFVPDGYRQVVPVGASEPSKYVLDRPDLRVAFL